MSASLATSPMTSLRSTARAFARRSGKGRPVSALASAVCGETAVPSGRGPRGASSLASRGALQRRRAAVDVVEVEGDEVSIDDDDLPFDLDEYKAVVKLLVTFQEPDWVNPWSNKTAQRSTGSGCVIRRHEQGGGGVILTAAHVVANATFIQVQLANSPEKHIGKVISVLHEVDLALVEVQDGLEDVDPVPLPAGKEVRLPKLREKVYVLGFPVGGNDLSITEGVVSRIEVQSYSHSHARALAVTVDAAINSGNSGGPVLSQTTGGLVGVAFQGYAGSSVENQGHMVPAPVVDRFLRSWEEGKDTREPKLPSLGVHLQLLNSPSLRSFLKMAPEHAGVMVTHVEHGSSAEGTLRIGDVLMEVDGVKLANDGSSVFLGQRLAMVAILQARFIGDEVPIVFLRDGKEMTVTVTLKSLRQLVPRGQYDVRPPFVLVGGLLFQPLSLEYLQSWGGDLKDAPTHLVEEYYDGVSGPEKKEVVVLSQVLSDDINVGFTFDSVGLDYVASVNHKPVADMAAFVEALRAGVHGSEEFITLEVTRGNVRNVVVLEVSKLRKADEQIQERYQVPVRHSVHFRDIHEK